MSSQTQQWNNASASTPVYNDGDLSEGGDVTDPEPDMNVDPPPPSDLDPNDPRGRRPCPFDKLQCCYCWTFVRTPLHMRKHMLNKHLDVKDHACHLCGKTFARPYMLRDHLARFHDMGADSSKRVQKRDPIKCEMCDKMLAGQDSHRRHMFSVHNVGTSPHTCHVCGKQFYKPYEVKEHLAKDHGLGEVTRRQERKRHM